MGLCKACGFCHPQPGKKTCRFSNDARERAKQGGDEDNWKDYLDLDTLVGFPQDEKPGVKTETGAEGMSVAVQDQLNTLNTRMNDLADQFKAFLSLKGHMPVSTPSIGVPLPPISVPTAPLSLILYLSRVVRLCLSLQVRSRLCLSQRVHPPRQSSCQQHPEQA